MQSLSPMQFIAYRDNSQVEPLLLDIRETWEHEICQIEGALLLPMSRISEHMHKLDKDRPTVVLCHHGMRSLQVAHYLLQNGFAEVINLEGGIAAWAMDLDPDMPGY